MFRFFRNKARIPACRKLAKLSPLHKKGALSNPGNYRMIAVSEVMYRIHANVLKDLVTDWCIQKNMVPDIQFGFYPGRSTLHPLFILRHLRHSARKLKPRQSPRLHAVFIEFSQAYDTVPRLQLWEHLQRIGDKRGRVRPTNGDKQGCPLCPLLFSLYINDMGRDISGGIRGSVTGDGVNGVSYMLYADDFKLSLTTNDP
eukprot:352268-Pelagomonas_calceolata.AAC.1